MKIKAISLWQPWATLMAEGHKRIETRSWPTKHRGLLAIHAAKNTAVPPIREFLEALEKLGLARRGVPSNFLELAEWDWGPFPKGAILGICRLTDCKLIHHGFTAGISDQERTFGDYTLGRHAWITDGMFRFPEPIACRGRQGLWDWDVPEAFRNLVRSSGGILQGNEWQWSGKYWFPKVK